MKEIDGFPYKELFSFKTEFLGKEIKVTVVFFYDDIVSGRFSEDEILIGLTDYQTVVLHEILEKMFVEYNRRYYTNENNAEPMFICNHTDFSSIVKQTASYYLRILNRIDSELRKLEKERRKSKCLKTKSQSSSEKPQG